MFKRISLSVILVFIMCCVVKAALLDPVTNFGKVTVSTGYDDTATSVALSSGHGARLPSTFSYNLIWWNSTDYNDPTDDPNREIVRVTNRSTDTLTVTRAQEGTSATTKNTAGKTYTMILGITKKVIDDIDLYFQPLDTDLTAIAGFGTETGNFIVGTGSGWGTETPSVALASIGGIGSAAIDTISELDTIVADEVLAGSATTNTFTNKTVDANGTGNMYTNFDEGNMLADSDILRGGVGFVIDGGGSAITTGIKGDIEVPYNCTIKRVTLLADQSGSIVVDLWKDTYANYPPTVADTITASAIPTISTAVKYQDATLTGWTTTLSAGDIIRINVNSASTLTRVLIALVVERT